MKKQMKLLTCLTKPLVLFVLLFALGVGNAWAGGNCGFYGDNTYIRLWVNGTTSVYLNCNGDGVSDLELGDVDELYLAEIRSIVWKNKDGYGNVCKVIMHYGINTSRNGSEGSTYDVGYNNSGYADWWGSSGDDTNKHGQQFKSEPDSWNLLSGLTPGTDYYLDFMFSIEGSDSNDHDCEPDKDKRDNKGGNYHVHFRVADSKSEFTAGKYLYFDARNLTNWQAKNFDTKYYFKKHYNPFNDVQNELCTKATALENWVYYVLIPEGDHIGRVQLNRVRPDGVDDQNYLWNWTNPIQASARANTSQNCLTGTGGHWSDWTPTWTTYCPPMSDVDLEENGTTLSWGGDGSSGDPYLIPTEASIKVKATNATKAVDDDNMTIYYQFKKAGTEVQAGSTTASATITASDVTGSKEAVTVEAYNYYNSTSGTHLASNEIYYEVRTPYTISYNAGTDGSGLRASETKLKGVNFATPNSAIFTRTGYTQTGWATSNGGSQLCALGGNYTSDADATLYPVWTANNYTVTLDNREADIEDGTESVNVTYDAITGLTSPIEKPEKAHYDFGGYYVSDDGGETLTNIQLIDENGNWKKGVSGYTGTSGDNATWVYAGDITLYAKWTEHEYAVTLAISPAGAGTTSPASSTTAKYVTASGNIEATANSGYSFRDWDFSKTDAVNDIYCADTYTSTSNPVRILAVHDGTLTANFTPNTYTVSFENLGADAGHKGSLDTTVTFNDTIHMKGRIEVPSKTNYDFGGYYTSDDEGETLGTQLIDENGNWKKGISGYTGTKEDVASWVYAGHITLYAKWTETAYTITPSVSPAGAGSVNTVTDAHLVTPSSDITATPTNAVWVFDHWTCGTNVGIAGDKGIGDNPVTVTASQNSTITAYFKHRYNLLGSKYEEGKGKAEMATGGMPGWTYGSGADFTIISYTADGDNATVDLSYTCTLEAGTYIFEIHDRQKGESLGRKGDGVGVYALTDGSSVQLRGGTDKDQSIFFYPQHAGQYTFRITYMTKDDNYYYPTVTIERPHQLHFGTGYAGIDNLSSVTSGTTGGTLAVTTSAGSLSNEDWVTYGTDVTYTPSAATGYTFEGFYTSNTYSSRFTQDNPWVHYNVTSDDNVYAKFVETSTSVTLSNDGHGKVQIGGEDATSTTCGVTTTRELTAVPDAGYKFKNWTTSSSPDFEVDDDDAAEVTLTGYGDGTAGTLTANFEERYSIKGTMNGENWGTTHTLSNIGTNASSKDTCYVTMTLPANTTYEFAIYDEQTGGWYKAGTNAVYNMTYTNHTNWEFGDTKTYDCGITTAGKGTYKFIFNITDTTVTVVYPASYQVNYGASVGGSVTSVKDDDNNDVPNGGYVCSGGSVVYTASANTGYTFVGWCGSDSYGDTFNTELSWTNNNVTETQNSFAKFKSTNFVIYRTGDMAEDDRAALDDVESYDGGTISETIEFRMKVRELDTWYTLCLPFEVSAVKVWEDGTYYDLVPFYRPEVGGTFYTGDYIIRTPKQTTDFPIAEFDDWRDPTSPTGYKPVKNTPYIIQWHDSYFSNRYVSFFGTASQEIPDAFSAGDAPSSDNVVNVYGNNSMQSGSVAGAYLLENDYGSNGAWLRLEDASEARTILPFECYIRANTPTTTKYRVLRRDMTIDDTPTGLDQIINRKSYNRKFIKDGQLFIIRDDKMYNVYGMEVQK